MPSYKFKCTGCGHEFRESLKFGDSNPKCPKCIKPVEQILEAPGLFLGCETIK